MSAQGNVIGQIEGLYSEANVSWKIPNYFSLSQKTNSFYESSHFPFLGSTWSFKIYPNGTRLNNTVEFVGIYVVRPTEGPDVQNENIFISFQIGIMCGDELKGKRAQRFCLANNMHAIGFQKCFKRQYLLKNIHKFDPQGTLTIKFVAKVIPHCTDAASQTGISNDACGLARDFQTLFETKRTADVAIIVGHRMFHVHKLILGARSTVFTAMFEHDMKGKTTAVVNIKDCDPDSFQDFLFYIYTNKIDNLSSDNVIGLYSLANKYDVNDLKLICVDFMKENLCLETVCDVLDITDKSDERELKISARKLLIKNIKTVMTTDSWIHFIRRNPELATEVLMTAIPRDRDESNEWRLRAKNRDESSEKGWRERDESNDWRSWRPKERDESNKRGWRDKSPLAQRKVKMGP